MSDDVSARVTSEPTGRRDVHWCLIVWREVPGLAPHAQAHMRVDFRARRVEVASADVKAYVCVYLLKRARSLERWRKFLMYVETL